MLRAVLMALLVVTPSLLLPMTTTETAQLVVVIAILAATLTFIEYNSRYPSIVEFRFASPVNRLKFGCLWLSLILMAVILRGYSEPTGWTNVLTLAGDGIGRALDFQYSPVRLIVLMLPADADAELIGAVRTIAGVSYAVSLLMMFLFITLVRMFGWPARKGAFNVWVNLPFFDPTRGGDVLFRLQRDAALNIVLGLVMPFLIPLAISAAAEVVEPLSLARPQNLIWTMTAWAFLPASMLMRGVALSRIAEMIEEKRRRVYAQANTEDWQNA